MSDGKRVILVIDDDEDYLEGMRAILEGNGYEMLGATTAEEGIRLYRSGAPDLIIVDLMMEEVDAGTRCVRQLLALGNRAPVLMASSIGDNLSLTADYTELGLAGLFQKPVHPDTLLTVIRSKLG